MYPLSHGLGGLNGVFRSIEHQGMVFETVAVIIHVVAVEEEGGVASLLYISIPRLLVGIAISFYLKHDI